MIRRLLAARRGLALVGIGSAIGVVAALLMAIVPSAETTPARALAYNPDRWDAGLIISDALFYDGAAMNAKQVQRFLDKMAPSSCSAVADTSTPCLADYTGRIRARDADSYCDAISGSRNQTSAQIITTVAQACGISPKVIIVTLQKEQGLVTSSDPSSWAYDHAMGWGCPDTAPCETQYNGLFNQVYRGSWQFVNYRYGDWWYQKGMTVDIYYSPTASCGTKRVTIKSWATAGLYIYTPYTPNKAALENYPGTASCGAYGNRNFWAYYNSWFGSTVAGSDIVTPKNNNNYFLLTDAGRWRIPAGDSALLKAFSGLLPSSTVSGSYLRSFELLGTMTRVVVGTGGKYYLINDGERHLLGASCAEVEEWGFSCESVPELSRLQLSDLPSGGAMRDLVQAGSALWLLGNGEKVQFASEELAVAAGFDLSSRLDIRPAAVADIPVGDALVESEAWFRVTTSDDRFILVDGVLYAFPSALLASVGADSWFTAPRSASLRPAGLVAFDTVELSPFLKLPDGTQILLTASGVVRLDAELPTDAEFVPVPERLVTDIPAVASSVEGPVFVRKSGGSRFWLLQDGERHLVGKRAERNAYADAMGLARRTLELPADALAGWTRGDDLYVPGTVLRAGTGGARYLVDAAGVGHKINPGQLRELTGGTQVTKVPPVRIRNLEKGETFSVLVMCGSDPYLVSGGTRYAVDPDVVADLEPALGSIALTSEVCKGIERSGKTFRGTLKAGDGQLYLVRDGEKFPISRARMQRLEAGPVIPASNWLLRRFPDR